MKCDLIQKKLIEVIPMEIYIILMFIAAAVSLGYIGFTFSRIMK